MLRLILALIAIVGLWAAMAYIKRLSPAHRRRLLLRSALWGGGLLLILMVATGRVHWIFVLIGALFPLAKLLLNLGLQLFPLWKRQQQKRQHSDQGSTQSPPGGPMTLREAMDTLGLKGELTELDREQIVTAHRRLMQKIHPDRGGNDYLAAKVNEAKELLLRQLG